MNFCIDAPILEVPAYPPIVFIDKDSEKPLKAMLAIIAKYFKTEMRFDNLQFDQSMYRNEDFVGVLFLHRANDLVKSEDHFPNRVIGGAVFVNLGDSYELDWVWLHPFSRNRKMLRNNWDKFRQRFGQFSVAAPLSAHMSDFIRKHHVPPNHKQGE